MRPYLAIIKDSFREAFATRILWFTLIAITLFLLVLAPIGFDEDLATQLYEDEVTDWHGLISQIQSAAEKSEASPGKHLWSLLNEDQRQRAERVLREGDDGNRNGPPGRLRDQRRALEVLNGLLKRDDLYDAAAWAKIDLPEEVKTELTQSSPGSIRRQAAHRRALGAAFPDTIELSSGGAVYATYCGIQPSQFPLPVGADMLREVLKSVLAFMVSVIFGWLGTVVAILVTGSIMPRTFEPGEITLLLSKPITRSWLYVARFLGGCTFTFVNVAYLMLGLWLIAGLRFGIWNHRLLLGIPLYTFLFAVYFSVSAFFGVRWGNAIIAVCLTIAFSLFLQSVVVVKQTCEFFLDPTEIQVLVPAGDDLIAVNAARETLLWDAEMKDWKPIFTPPGRAVPAFERRMRLLDSHFHPRFDAQTQRLVALNPQGNWFANEVLFGLKAENWERQPQGRLTDSITELFVDPQGRVLCVGTGGLYEFRPAAAKELDQAAILEAATGGFWKPQVKTGTQPVHPDDFERVRREDAIAMNSRTGDLWIYRKGTLTRYERGEAELYRSESVPLPEDLNQAEDPPQALLAAGQRTAICLETGEVLILGEQIQRYSPFQDVAPASAEVSPDGRWLAVLFHTGQLWLYDFQASAPAKLRLPSQGQLSAVQFVGDAELLIADQRNRVRTVSLENAQILHTYDPPGNLLEWSYDWGVVPLYTCLPQPGELNRIVQTLMTEKTTEVVTMGPATQTNLQQERVVYDNWTPIWSSLAFIVVMLALGCWQIARRDF